MKFLATQLTYLLTESESRRNLRALGKYLIFLAVIIAAFSVIFHVIMVYEGQRHSWMTGVYWTLTVMSTLGFGDITFHSDLGRAFTVFVLLSGIILLLIVLPFAFIRYFYAPWLDAQMRAGAPTTVPDEVERHVIICHYDELGRALGERLRDLGIPYYFIETDAAKATALHADRVPVVSGELDSRDVYANLRVRHAAMVVANLDDATNTNITLTVREESEDVQIVATAEDKDSIDVLELSGASSVVALKHRLGRQLAARVASGTAAPHTVGKMGDLRIAEFPVHGTPFAGKTVRESKLRHLTGLSVVAVWERGKVSTARPNTLLSDYSVAVVVGTESQLDELAAILVIYQPNDNPVVVLGGGKVGRAVARGLKERELTVHIVEENPELLGYLEEVADRVFIGDAANIEVMTAAGVKQAPSIVLTTADDAMNVFLAVYCRRLSPDARIISRITHERNLEAIHRAGADFALGYHYLGVMVLLSLLQKRELLVVEEGLDLFVVDVPESLVGKSLHQSEIGARTGLNVVAIKNGSGKEERPRPDAKLLGGVKLMMLGTTEQKREFDREFA